MSKNLSRVTAKIFAGEAPLNAVGQFGSALNGTKVNTTDIATIQGLEAYEQGWSSAVVTNRNYPTLEETNGVLKAMSYQTAYNMQKGVAEWDEGTTYFSGDICKGVATGILYTSRSDNNIGNPVTDTTYWKEYQGSASSIPATNYIAEINGSASFSNNTVTLPDMTLYIPNGRSGNGTLDNIVENVASKTYTVSGNGTYTLLYNNSNQDLLLAPNYETRLEELPETGNYDDVAYLLDNKMYVVESTNPNYVESDGVTVSSDGIVSNLGTLSAQIATAFPSLPVLNLNFTTGNDVTTAQSLFSIPYAKGNITNGNLDIAIYSLAYSVNYFSQVYSGAYTLTNQAITYSYLINNETYYTKTPIQVGISVYENASFDMIYGTVTSLENGNIVISNITTAYDGSFSLVSNGDYYTYTLGATNYYTSEALATGVSVYTDTALSELFGIVTSVEGNTVLIQNTTEVYNGVYSDTSTRVYTYTVGENTLYSSGVLIPGLTIYINSDLTVPYGVVENITTQNVVIHSTQSEQGYVAKSGSGAVPSNNPIYADVNLQSEITTSTGANATYTGESSLSQVGTLTYELNTSTNYSGTLSFNGTAYTLVLNDTSTSLLSSRTPYIEQSPAIVFGGSNGFLGTINLSGTSVDSVWTWNGYNTVSPDWTVEQLCKIGSITLANNEVTALDLDNVIELVKMSDLDNLNISASGGSGFEVGDIGIAPLGIDETKGLRRYLNGSTMAINTNTKAFVNKLKTASELYPSLVCTESEWQAISTLSVGGQCGKFVIGEDTIRLPRIIMPIQGLTNLSKLGELVKAGLPNVKTEKDSDFFGVSTNTTIAAPLTKTDRNINRGYSISNQTDAYLATLGLDFSTYSNLYKDSYTTVQQEQIQYPYFIQVATGQETEVDIRNEIELNNPFFFGMSMYLTVEPENLSWLKSNGQYNKKAVYSDYYDWILENVNKGTKDFKTNMAYTFNGSINCWFPVRNPIVDAWAYSTTDGTPIGQVETTNEDGSLVVNGQTVTFTGGGNAGESLFTDYDFILKQEDETFRLPIKSRKRVLVKTLSEDDKYCRIYSDGWCEQYGASAASTSAPVDLLKKYIDKDYIPLATVQGTNSTNLGNKIDRNSVSQIIIYNISSGANYWHTSGYLASGEYESDLSLYYYVGETVQNANLIDAGRLAESLADKINMKQAAKASRPSQKSISLTINASGSTYTAPSDGWFSAQTLGVTYFMLENKTRSLGSTSYTAVGFRGQCNVEVSEGDIVAFNYSQLEGTTLKFIYAEGAQ